MSCVFQPNNTISEEQEQALLSRGANPRTRDPNLVNKLAVPLICLSNVINVPVVSVASVVDILVTVMDISGHPQQGDLVVINGQSTVTDANGNAGPFSISIPFGSSITVTVHLETTQGTPFSGQNITLGGVTKITDANGNVTFIVSWNGVVS